MALTATATKSSRRKICQTLGMVKPDVIAVSPDRPNIEYRVESKKDTIEEQFSPLVEESIKPGQRLPPPDGNEL